MFCLRDEDVNLLEGQNRRPEPLLLAARSVLYGARTLQTMHVGSHSRLEETTQDAGFITWQQEVEAETNPS